MSIALAIMAALASTAAPQTTPAHQAAEPIATVQYADLDLTTSADQAVFDQRLRSAVRDVCGASLPRSDAERDAARDCRKQGLAAAEQVRARVLARIDRGRRPTQVGAVAAPQAEPLGS